MARSTQVAILVAASLFAAANVRADDNAMAQADRLFKEGRRDADHGDYIQACRHFEESFRLDPGVGTLVNLGDCAEHLGEIERAYGYYRTAYARMAPTDDRTARVRERVENIEQHAAKLVLKIEEGAPEGTVVTVDGTVVEPKKTPLHVAKGAHVVLVTAVGFRGARYVAIVGDGETRLLSVTPGTPLEAVLPTPAPKTTTEEAHASTWPKPAAITAIGLGVAGIWIGSLTGLVAIDRRDVQRDECTPRGCTQAGVDAAHDGATWASVSTIAFVGGGVLLAAGATFAVLAVTGKKSVSVGVGLGSLVVGGRFE